jgi:ferrous iron transport protein A
MIQHESKILEFTVCNPDRSGRILKSDHSGRSFNTSLRTNVIMFKRPQGVRHVSALSELKVGETAVQNHLMHMGFVPDARITALRRAPAGDPTVFGIDGMEIALRHETAGAIRVRIAEIELEQKPGLRVAANIAVPQLRQAIR